MTNRFFISILVLFLYSGCTRDDICAEDTPTTPLLQVEFKDITDRTENKPVTSFRLVLNGTDTLASVNTTDTLVSVPLNTLANTTLYEFLISSDNEDNGDNLTFTYSTQEQYVNRACAFRIIYNEFQTALEPEVGNGNWIRDFTVQQTTIEDETEAHLTIFH
ncbi:MAG: DUF6452 family protein [Bacteroidota bacterium]